MRRSTTALLGTVAATALVLPLSATGSSAARDHTPAEALAVDSGFQLGAKDQTPTKAELGPNPYLANLPDLDDADYFAWRKKLAADSSARARSTALKRARTTALGAAQASAPPFVHDEEEPAGSAGSNDSHADAERVDGFGTGAKANPRVRILGQLAQTSTASPRTLATAPEDNGSLATATDSAITGSGAVRTTSVLGDGPHGPEGTGSNDFDFVKVQVAAGNTLVADTEGTPTGLDTILAVYDSAGEIVAADDDSGTGTLSAVRYRPAAAGTYYVLVAGYSRFGPLPADPNDSGSGAGGADTGDYALTIRSQRFDADYYSVRLRPGDVVGAVGKGVATGLTVRTPSGAERVGAVGMDASALYPPSSPLPGGGNTTLAYVAEEAGWYSVEVSGTTGSYDVLVEGYRPGTQGDAGRRQTVLLDFAPGRVNTGTWGGPGVRDVSPFASFVPKWGIARSEARRMENRIVNVVRANLQREVQAAGLNPRVNVEVLNARGNENLVGKDNVSRIYVAGTIAESGISTIGIAQYIDPGNFGHQDEAIVLLDVLSAPAGPASSLNTFMDETSDRVAFVSNAVANVTAHEVGHTTGSYHTDNADEVPNVMDSGGANFATNLYGVGPDGIGGTADDANVRFVTDTYSPVEGFTGLENTLNVSAWAYAGR